MKKAILLIITFTCTVIIMEAQSAKHLPEAYTSAQLRKTITITAAAFNVNDSKILVSSNESGIFNVHEINVADKKSTALTNSKEDGMYAVDYLPTPKIKQQPTPVLTDLEKATEIEWLRESRKTARTQPVAEVNHLAFEALVP